MTEKLLELISQVQDCGADVTDVVEMIWVENQTLVDHLISNGVVIPVRCKDCKYGEMCSIREAMCCTDENGYCWRGERRTDG